MLVSCVAYENGRKIADIPVADISEYVHRPECFIWVALFEPTREEHEEAENDSPPTEAEDGSNVVSVDFTRKK